MVMTKSFFISALVLCLNFALPCFALTGQSDAPVGSLNTEPPLFGDLMVNPHQASVGDTITISFRVSKILDTDPSVLINGNIALPASDGKLVQYLFEYTVLPGHVIGMATISINGQDSLGNAGTLIDTSSLEIIESIPELPLQTWPWVLLFLIIGCLLYLRRYNRTHAAWIIVGFLAVMPIAAFAQSPIVSNVSFTQGPGENKTKVDIQYDLVAPNGPCDITVLLSKNGGSSFDYEVNTISGAINNVDTGNAHLMEWDISADYPNEDMAQASIRVIANDYFHLLSYIAGTGGTIVGNATQTVSPGTNGTQVEAVPDAGYAFVKWDDGLLTSIRQDINVLEDIIVTASFAPVIYTVDYLADPPEGGSLSGPANINHNGTGAEDTIVFTVTVNEDWILTGVDASNGSINHIEENEYSLSGVTENTVITASFESALPTPDHIVGPGETFETLDAAVADSSVLNGHTILVKNAVYEAISAISITKELYIYGESRDGVIFKNSTTLAPDLANLLIVTADNVTFSQITVEHNSTNANAFAISAQSATWPNQKIEAFTMKDCLVKYSKYGVFYRSRNSLMQNLRLEVIAGSGTRYALLPAGNAGNSSILNCVFVDNFSTNNRLIYMNGIGGASDQDWSGTLNIIGSTNEGFVAQFVNHDSLVGSPDSFELLIKDNIIQETNAFVVVLGGSGNLYSRIIIANNTLTNNHHSSGYGKGAFGIVDSSSGSFRSTPLPVFASNNALGQLLFRVDWTEAPGSSGSIVGYSPSSAVGSLIPNFIDFNVYVE